MKERIEASNRKKPYKQKLLAYSTLTATALAFAAPSQGDVVRHDVDPDFEVRQALPSFGNSVLGSETTGFVHNFPVDFDQDGYPELSILNLFYTKQFSYPLRSYPTPGYTVTTGYRRIAVDSNAVLAALDNYVSLVGTKAALYTGDGTKNGTFPAALEASVFLPGELSFTTNFFRGPIGDAMAKYAHVSTFTQTTGGEFALVDTSIPKYGMPWEGQREKYLGVKFSLSIDEFGNRVEGQEYYGWVKLSVSADASMATVHSYAYEDTGGTIHTDGAGDVDLSGDANADGQLNLQDVIYILQKVTGVQGGGGGG